MHILLPLILLPSYYHRNTRANGMFNFNLKQQPVPTGRKSFRKKEKIESHLPNIKLMNKPQTDGSE
jgi:hypothetical protein